MNPQVCDHNRSVIRENEDEKVVIGVDVGGTKIAAGIVDAGGNILQKIRQPTDTRDSQASLDSIARTVQLLIAERGTGRQDILGIGLGIPGLVDPGKGIGLASVNLNWRDVLVVEGIERRLGLPCWIENDVRAAALGEARYGAGRDIEDLIYLSIGTGIAATVLFGKKVYRGVNGIAGEIGHAVVVPDGPLCKCGTRGCFEAVASGPAIANRAKELVSSYPDSFLLTINQGNLDSLSAIHVFESARQGDACALETLDQVGGYIAFTLQFLILAYDPQAIILGGGVPLAGDPFLGPILKHLHKQAKESWLLAKALHPGLIRLAALGEQSGILGAAALVPTNLAAAL